jgi:hypothetical protein
MTASGIAQQQAQLQRSYPVELGLAAAGQIQAGHENLQGIPAIGDQNILRESARRAH